MSDLTVHPDFKVDVRERVISLSTKEALLLLCPVCGNLKTMYMYALPLYSDRQERLRLSSCHCWNKPIPIDMQKILREISSALATCKTIEDAQQMIQTLASREEMRDVWA